MDSFLSFLKQSVTPYQTVHAGLEYLEESGFKQLSLKDEWKLEPGTGYTVNIYDTTMFAFTTGKTLDNIPSLKLAAAHTDQPGFRLKPNCEIKEKGYIRLNTSCYGGAILSSWLDRPLSLAGKLCLKGNDSFHPKTLLVDLKRPLLTIPSLAIHMNRDVNKGTELNKQTDMLPLFAAEPAAQDVNWSIQNLLAHEYGLKPSDILDYDLYVYNTDTPCETGLSAEYLSAPRLDNLTSVYALLKGITAPAPTNCLNMIALFDNEEIGSRSKQGADSRIGDIILERIFNGLGMDKDMMYRSLPDALLFSADVAHATHPNYPSKNDPTNPVTLGGGVVLKTDASQKYATDTEIISIFKSLCNANDIPYQTFANRSDQPGGSTLGSIVSAWLPIRTVDLGVPLLAMHSSRELMGIQDQKYLNKLIHCLFSGLQGYTS